MPYSEPTWVNCPLHKQRWGQRSASLRFGFREFKKMGHMAQKKCTIKIPQSGHTTNFQYVTISVHIPFYFVSVAQFFEKLILSVARFWYRKVF